MKLKSITALRQHPDGSMDLDFLTEDGSTLSVTLDVQAARETFLALISLPVPTEGGPVEMSEGLQATGVAAFAATGGHAGLAFLFAQGTRLLPVVVPTSGIQVLLAEARKLELLVTPTRGSA